MAKQKRELAVADVEIVELEIPLAPQAEGYATRHIELQLSPDQASAIRRVQDGLIRARGKLENGRVVGTAADVIRWMADQLAK